MRKELEYIRMEEGSQPWIITFTADVNYNGFWIREEVARYNFYSKSGYTAFNYDQTNGIDLKKEYKSFGHILNAIYKIDSYFGWTETMVNNAKKAAKAEEKKSIKEAEERYQQYLKEQEEADQQIEVESQVNEEQAQPEPKATYTAYNRSFNSYEEAYNYCIQSDFDPSYIESEEPNKASQPLPLDLQLFAHKTEEAASQPFKKPYATYKNGVSKFGIGKHLDLIYTIETTGKDPIQDEINYSNIQQHKRDNIQEALNLFKLFQEQGYYNLQIWVEVHYKNETIIENGTNQQLELMVNDSSLREAKKIINEYEKLINKVEQYEAFLKQYKAKDLFAKYLADNSN